MPSMFRFALRPVVELRARELRREKKRIVPEAAVILCALVGVSACGSAAEGGATSAPGASSSPNSGNPSESDAGATSSPAPASSNPVVDAGASARCKVTHETVFCEHNVTKVVAGTAARDVYWQTPVTPPPPGGYPVVVMYQGSFGGPSLTWGVMTPEVAFGGFHQGILQAELLEHGFTVVAPEAAAGIAWQTNSGVPYDLSTDKPIVDALLTAIADGQFGPADPSRLYATGISSGGYMTSRMAVSHPGVFRALAIQSGSYATCLGPVCIVPNELPADHPPTLFLHGEVDATVPLFTAKKYYDALLDQGFETAMVTDPKAGHEWLPVSPARVTAWFEAH